MGGALGGYVYLFILWRNLKEDYPSAQIFSIGIQTIVSVILGALLAQFLSPSLHFRFLVARELWFWGAVGGYFLSFSILVSRAKMRYWEVFQYGFLGILSAFFVLLLTLIPTSGVSALYPLVLIVISLGVFAVIQKNYRKFAWYRSGKVGLAGIVAAAVFFMGRAVIAASGLTMLSLAGPIDVLVSALIAFLLFFNAYNISQTS